MESVIARLEALANPTAIAGMARFGISTDGTYGISVPVLRRVAREIGRDHELALALWASGKHEARALACMVEEPARVTSRQADAWARDLESWDICDGFAYDLMSRTPIAYAKVRAWAGSRREFVRRAAFALLAGLAVHDKRAPDSVFIELLPLIAEASTDERHFVKKGVNWALRQVGKRNIPLNRAAEELRRMNSRSARWIAADALRELRSDAVQVRLRRAPGTVRRAPTRRRPTTRIT